MLKDYQEVERIARKIMSDNGGIDEVDDPSLFEDICQALTTYGNARVEEIIKMAEREAFKVNDGWEDPRRLGAHTALIDLIKAIKK
jgi:hypothetical protein